MATHTEQYLQKEIRKMMSLSRQIQPLKLQRNTSKRKIDEEKHRFNKSMDKADSVSRHLLPQIKDKSTSMHDEKDDNNLNITSLIQNIREGNKTEQKVNFESIKLYKDNEPRNQRLVSIDEYYWKAQKLPGMKLYTLTKKEPVCLTHK